MSMTDNAANIAVCNQALGMLGAEEITLAATTEQNYVYCATFFDDARDEILAAARWNFAMKHAYAIQTTDPLFKWDNAFTYPTDAIKVWGIADAPDAEWEPKAGLILTNEGETPSDWVTATDYLAGEYLQSDDTIAGTDLTYLVDEAFTSTATSETTDLSTYCTSAGGDLDVLKVEYVYQRTDVDAWPVSARQCLIINLARMLAPAIKQNEEASLNLQAMLYGSSKVTGYLQIARTIDAQEGGSLSVTTRTLLSSRRSRRGYYS